MLVVYFIIVPVLWVFLGGFCIGVLESLDNDVTIPFSVKLTMLMFAPLTITITLIIVLYMISFSVARKIVKCW